MNVSRIRWKDYLQLQKGGKRNMFGYDMVIQKNYNSIYKHFEEDNKKGDWTL